MKNQCQANNDTGKPCHKYSQIGGVYCKMHLEECQNLFKEYKSICEQAWSQKCTKDMSTEDLLEIQKMAKECAKLRSMFQAECCRGQYDKGHFGAINKMIKIMKSCESEIGKRNKRQITNNDLENQNQNF